MFFLDLDTGCNERQNMGIAARTPGEHLIVGCEVTASQYNLVHDRLSTRWSRHMRETYT